MDHAALLDLLPGGVLVGDADGTIEFANPAARALLGLPEAGVLPPIWHAGFHPSDANALRSAARAVLAGRRGEDRAIVELGDCYLRIDLVPFAGERWLAQLFDVSRSHSRRRELADAERRMRAIANTVAEGVIVLDAQGRVVEVDGPGAALFGREEHHLVGRAFPDPSWELVDADGVTIAEDADPAAMARKTMTDQRGQTVGIGLPNGRRRWLELAASCVVGIDGPQIMVAGRDVTASMEAEAALRRFFEMSRDALIVLDEHGRIVRCNRGFVELLGTERQAVGQTLDDLIEPEERTVLAETIERLWQEEQARVRVDLVHERADGARFTVEWQVSRDPGSRRLYAVGRDVTAARAETADLERRALHDPLTGLPNREVLVNDLPRILARAERGDRAAAVLFVDLDGFKEVNDTLGHATGDLVLSVAADRIRRACRGGDLVCRVGGDEFVVVAEDLVSKEVAHVVAQRIVDALGEPIPTGAGPAEIGASVGLAVADDNDGPERLLRRADRALYEAKRGGRNRFVDAEPPLTVGV